MSRNQKRGGIFQRRAAHMGQHCASRKTACGSAVSPATTFTIMVLRDLQQLTRRLLARCIRRFVKDPWRGEEVLQDVGRGPSANYTQLSSQRIIILTACEDG
jgi:hypothetical protein